MLIKTHAAAVAVAVHSQLHSMPVMQSINALHLRERLEEEAEKRPFMDRDDFVKLARKM